MTRTAETSASPPPTPTVAQPTVAAVRAGAAARPRFASGRFYACLAVLLICGAAMQVTSGLLKAYFRKLPLPLKAHLYAMDREKLLPRYDLFRVQPEPLDHEMIENLGTDEYLQWAIANREKAPHDRTHVARLFVSYYTGQPDMVPHNPRECMTASGWQLRSDETEQVEIHYRGAPLRIPVAVLGFAPPTAQGQKDDPALTVMFFFYANGQFETTRLGVRTATQNLWHRHAFYSKVEVSFTDESLGRFATRAESLAAVGPLLQTIVPILMDDHYPDWQTAQSGADEATRVP